jgi:hypothetical protein
VQRRHHVLNDEAFVHSSFISPGRNLLGSDNGIGIC